MDDAPNPPTRRKRKEGPDYGWPAAMRRATAAAYLDMSEDALIREVSARRLPSPFTLGGRDHWRKDAIDAALDYLTGGQVIPEYRRRFNERHGLTAYDLWKAREK